MQTTYISEKLPKYIIGYSDDDRELVMHLHKPRFIMEMDDDGEPIQTMFIDPSGDDITQIEKWQNEALDYYDQEISKLDEDGEEDDAVNN